MIYVMVIDGLEGDEAQAFVGEFDRAIYAGTRSDDEQRQDRAAFFGTKS